MLKTHLTYLRKAVRISVNARASETIVSILEKMPNSKKGIYALVRDITGDARFYSVTDIEDDFWQIYGTCAIMRFLDSIPEETWRDEEKLTALKEDFLNDWIASHILPLSGSERMRKGEDARIALYGIRSTGGGASMGGNGIFSEDEGVQFADFTQSEEMDFGKLPENLKILARPEFERDREKAAGRGEGEEESLEIRFLQRLDPDLLRLARMIGRSGGERVRKGKYHNSTKSDISGITTGNDLNSVVPTELALLSTPSTEKLFLKKFTSRQLQIFSSASVSQEKGKDKSGPIYICVDTSGSMSGEPEVMAKTLAMAVAIIAQKERRPLILINYSHKVSFFVLTDLASQKRNLLSFLTASYSGANNEDMLFRFLFKVLPRQKKYRRFKNLFEGADLLVISDFIWMMLQPDTLHLLQEAREKGMKVYSLGVEYFSSGHGFHQEEEYSEEIVDGYGFFERSDYRFTYNDGYVTQQK